MATSDVLVILQARFGSSRLPGKVLAPLDGVPLVRHCLRRLIAASVGPVRLATTTLESDDAVAAEGGAAGVEIVRGAVDDVLERFILASADFTGRFVIRATADNPAVDVDAPRRVLQYLAAGADYVVETGLPLGSAVEGIRLDVMRQAHERTRDAYDREHVTPWVKTRPDVFRIVMPEVTGRVARPDLCFTVDTHDDLAYMERVLTLAQAGRRLVALHDIIGAADRLASGGRLR